MNRWLIAAILIAPSLEAAVLPAVTEQAARQWKQIASPSLTPDGKWFVYELRPSVDDGADVVVVLRSTSTRREVRFPAGGARAGAGSPRLSESGRWLAFYSVTAGQPKSVVLVSTETGHRRELTDAQEFQFLGTHTERLLIRNARSNLVVHDLDRVNSLDLGEVSALSVSSQRDVVAWSGAGRLSLYRVEAGRTHVLNEIDGGLASELTWSRSGRALAALTSGNAGQIVYLFRLDEDGSVRKRAYDPSSDTALREGLRLGAPLKWRDDDKTLFVTAREKLAPAPRPKLPDNLTIWHGHDEQLPTQKNIPWKLERVHLIALPLEGGRAVRLSDAALPRVEPTGSGQFVLGYTTAAYGWENESLEGKARSQLRDYYLIDVSSGARTRVLPGLKVVTRPRLSVVPMLSPDGSRLLYQDVNGDYLVKDLPDGATRNLTSGLGTRFYFPENAPGRDRQPRDSDGLGGTLVQGWSRDGEYVLISDYYDVWALSLSGQRAMNLTKNGRAREISYIRIDMESLAEPGLDAVVDLRRPLYFRALDRASGNTGLARVDAEKNTVETLHSEYADLRYLKARRADVVVASRMTAVESTDYFTVDAAWKPHRRMTDVNPQQREFQWSPGTRYFSYPTPSGSTGHAILYLPAGYTPGRSYPTIVQIYKGVAHAVHQYRAPFDRYNAVERYIHNGYAVLNADILPVLDAPGESALQAVSAAVDAGVSAGIVDRSRLGLLGYSYGGFETLYIVSRSPLFRAAAPAAGMSNLLGHCAGLRQKRDPAYVVCEADQPYMTNPWWRDPSTYISNSAVFAAGGIRTPLLLTHGDSDGAVLFSQSLEMFLALRSAGHQDVVLLQYGGQDHVLTGASDRDADERTAHFFDHFLKGMPAPAWWSEGLSQPMDPKPPSTP